MSMTPAIYTLMDILFLWPTPCPNLDGVSPSTNTENRGGSHHRYSWMEGVPACLGLSPRARLQEWRRSWNFSSHRHLFERTKPPPPPPPLLFILEPISKSRLFLTSHSRSHLCQVHGKQTRCRARFPLLGRRPPSTRVPLSTRLPLLTRLALSTRLPLPSTAWPTGTSSLIRSCP